MVMLMQQRLRLPAAAAVSNSEQLLDFNPRNLSGVCSVLLSAIAAAKATPVLHTSKCFFEAFFGIIMCGVVPLRAGTCTVPLARSTRKHVSAQVLRCRRLVAPAAADKVAL